jgi:hypothetical protein
MPLDNLANLFNDLGMEPTADQTYKMYGIFLEDFKRNTLTVLGRRIKINENKSKDPIFKKKIETFVHLVTRESTYTGKRVFDRHRANRIHWVKPILENIDDERILHFERLNDKGQNQHYFWYQEMDFIVILREINPDFLLVTSFCIDRDNRQMYEGWYNEYNI